MDPLRAGEAGRAHQLAECAARSRWEFLLTVSPIRVHGGTGCPVNPLALF